MRKNTSNNRRRRAPSQKNEEDRQIARDENPRTLPPLMDQLCVGMTLRFVTTSAFNGVVGVTAQNLLDAWFIAGTATTAYTLFDFVKVKSVTIRALPSATTGGVTNVAVEFFGVTVGAASGGNQKMNTSLGYDMPSYVKVKPGPKAQAGQFLPNTTASLFTVRASDVNANPLTGAIIDVKVVYRNSADVNPAALGTARTGLTPGHLYFGSLDGATDAATQVRSVFVPRA